MSEVTPETKLWQSVLNVAVDDALQCRTNFVMAKYGIRAYKYKKGKIKEVRHKTGYLKYLSEIDEARIWFKYPNQHFNFVCTSADCDAQSVYDRMKKNINKMERQEKY